MIELVPNRAPGSGLEILCLGAHSDDLEIGCGGTILSLLSGRTDVSVRWVVFSGAEERQQEARRSAELFLCHALHRDIELHAFRDGYFPYEGAAIKDVFEALKRSAAPHLIFTHASHDRHQDHRLIAELTWNTFRSHAILEYEVPKYDGDLATPNLYVPLTEDERQRKTGLLLDCFATQRDRHWFTPDTFNGLLRLRGLECASPSGYAEGFHARKLVFAAGAPG